MHASYVGLSDWISSTARDTIAQHHIRNVTISIISTSSSVCFKRSQ